MGLWTSLTSHTVGRSLLQGFWRRSFWVTIWVQKCLQAVSYEEPPEVGCMITAILEMVALSPTNDWWLTQEVSSKDQTRILAFEFSVFRSPVLAFFLLHKDGLMCRPQGIWRHRKDLSLGEGSVQRELCPAMDGCCCSPDWTSVQPGARKFSGPVPAHRVRVLPAAGEQCQLLQRLIPSKKPASSFVSFIRLGTAEIAGLYHQALVLTTGLDFLISSREGIGATWVLKRVSRWHHWASSYRA